MKSGKLDLEEVEILIKRLGGEDKVRRFLSGELKVAIVEKGGNKKQSLLIHTGNYSAVSVDQRHDPESFYRIRSGLYVSDFFRARIVAAAKPTEEKRFKRIPRFELTKPATGEELLAEWPQSVWKAGDFCGWLAQKLSKQSTGEVGEISRDNWTIALVKGINEAVLVVSVEWFSVDRGWDVFAVGLSVGWGAGDQFISRN